MKTFFTRTASALVFVVIMLGGILWNQYSFAALMSLILIGTLHEYYNITASKIETGSAKISVKWFVIILSLLVYLRSYLLSSPPAAGTPDIGNLAQAGVEAILRMRDGALPLNVMIPILIFVIFIYELFNKTENPFSNIGWNVVAIVWIVIPITLTNKIYFEQGGIFLLAVFALIWLYDAASYVFGSVLGKHKLIERISPKKTVEGMIGGVIITLAVAFFIHKLKWFSQYSNLEWVAIAFILIISSTFGDLVESMLKRSLNVKDSGSIMPGHGGFLDRFDAYLFSVPFAVLAVWLIDQFRNMKLIFDYLSN